MEEQDVVFVHGKHFAHFAVSQKSADFNVFFDRQEIVYLNESCAGDIEHANRVINQNDAILPLLVFEFLHVRQYALFGEDRSKFGAILVRTLEHLIGLQQWMPFRQFIELGIALAHTVATDRLAAASWAVWDTPYVFCILLAQP
jgi:hypothetical protein